MTEKKLFCGREAVHQALKAVKFFLFVILLASCVSCSAPNENPSKASREALSAERRQYVFEGRATGAPYHVTLAGAVLSDAEYKKLHEQIEAAFAELDRQMSTYREDSEISRFNNRREATPFAVSHDFLSVTKQALEIAKASDGAFDPSIRPLVELWGFGASKASGGTPGKKEISQAAALVDYRKIRIDEGTGTIAKSDPKMSLDLSGIAQGFGSDVIAALLESHGYNDFVVELGGEVRAKGLNKNNEPWRVGIDRPSLDATVGENLQVIIALKDLSVSTSGDYRKYREVGGRRVSHTIDPKLKGPIEHNLASVSIVAKTCAEADGIATAVDVLGPEKGLTFVKSRPGVEAFLVTRNMDGSFETTITEGFGRLILR